MGHVKKEKCDGCGATPAKPNDDLVTVDGADYQHLAVLCRGGGRRNYEPKNACLAKFLMAREPVCVVCGGELYSWKAGNRIRPVCKSCEADLEQLKASKKGRAWFAFDVFAMFGQPLPSNTHAPYSDFGKALIAALGGVVGERVGDAEYIVDRNGGGFRGDRHTDGSAQLTPDQVQGVRDLVEAYAAVIERVAESQKKEGGDLLVRLARGEVSIEDYEDGRTGSKRKAD